MKPFVLVLCSEVLSVELLCLLIILLPTHVVTYLHSMFFSHFHFFDPAAVPFCELFSTSMGGTTNLSEGQVELFWSNQSCLSWGCLSRSAAALFAFAPEGGHELLTHPHVGPSCSLSDFNTTEIGRNFTAFKYDYLSLKLSSTCGNSFLLCIFREW